MNDKRFQVFVSSTYTDLIEARREIINLVMESYNFPVGMEMFGADDSDQWTFIQRAIDITDIYILILGHRYGSLAPDGVSYTEKEFDYAVSKGIPVLSFIRHEDVSTKSSEREIDPEKIAKMSEFRRKASANKLCAFWTEISDLKASFATSFYKNIAKCQGVGWVRGDQAVSPEVANQLVILVDENRQLRDENTKLKEISSRRLPKLVLGGALSEEVKLVFSLKNLVPMSKADAIDISRLGELLHFLDIEDVIKYNESIPSDQEVYQNNLVAKSVYLMEEYKKPLDFFVENIGGLKATSVSLIVRFPKFLLVSNKRSLEKKVRDMRDELIVPMENPLIEAEEKFRISKSEELVRLNMMRNFIANNNSQYRSAGSNIMRSQLMSVQPVSEQRIYSMDSANNEFSVSLDELIHKRKFSVADQFFLVPLEEGEGMIEISIMCAEYLEDECFEIPIRVIKED